MFGFNSISEYPLGDAPLGAVSNTKTWAHATDVLKLPSTITATPAFVRGVQASGSTPTSNSLALGGTANVGDLVVLGANYSSATAPGTISDNGGNTWNRILNGLNSNTSFWYTIVTTPMTTITVPWSQSGWNYSIIAQQFTGISAAPSVDVQSATQPGTSNPWVSTLTTTAQPELLIVYSGNSNNAAAFSQASGYSNGTQANGDSSYNSYMQSAVSSTVGTQTVSVPSNNGSGQQFFVAFKNGTVQGNRPQARRHTADGFKRFNLPSYTRSHTTSLNKSARTLKSHTADTFLRYNKNYSRAGASTLPTGTTDLTIPYTNADYANVAADDSTYVGIADSTTYLLHQFKYDHTNNTDAITVTWNGKSTAAASVKTVYLQIFNSTTGNWETIASNGSAAANTDFTLTGSVSTNLSNYYSVKTITARVYQ